MAESEEVKYKMDINLSVLKHLGLNLYSNSPSVLSEIVANSHDADATEVRITVSPDRSKITIVDDGHGMTLQEINDKFLMVGYQRRSKGEKKSRKFKRPVMGRKGIGKLSLLSIANDIRIHTITEATTSATGEVVSSESNALLISRHALEKTISANRRYQPEDIAFEHFDKSHGTMIVITEFKKDIDTDPDFLRPRLAKRFSLKTGGKHPFMIYINDREITLDDRNFFDKIQFLWPIGDLDDEFKNKYSGIKYQPSLPAIIKDGENEYAISGWLATVDKPSYLKVSGENNNKVSILCRGKMAQEDVLAFYTEGGIYSSYLIGEVHADFLDDDQRDDIATTNRQQINEEDPLFKLLMQHIYTHLKTIQNKWTDLRNEGVEDRAITDLPLLKEWYDGHKSDTKKQAKKLFAAIENLHIDGDIDKKKELYKYGILAFERMRISDNLSLLNEIPADNLVRFGEIFATSQDLEASMYYDIAKQRVEIIKKLSDLCDDNAKERIIQNHIYENLWLLNSSWERATAGTERLEQAIRTEFENVTAKLTREERDARIDIRYRSAAGKHIIVELKRYNATYKFDKHDLAKQIEKYIKALRKALLDIDPSYTPIVEAICVVGPEALDNMNEANDALKHLDARVLSYDKLINDALSNYGDYLEKHKEAGKILQLVESL